MLDAPRGRESDEREARQQELTVGLVVVIDGALGSWAYYPNDLDETGRGIRMGLALPALVVMGLWLAWRGPRRR